MIFFKKYFYFIIVFLIPFSFVKASTVQTDDDLFPVRILCENLQAKIEMSINEKGFILNTVLVEFNPILSDAWGINKKLRTVFISYDGYIPKNFWNNITFDEPYISYGQSRADLGSGEELPCRDDYDISGPCSLSNGYYVETLPTYITTSTHVYTTLQYSGPYVDDYGIKINRKSLEGEFKYSSFYPGKNWGRRKNDSGVLQCKLLKAGDKTPNYLNIWNKYQQKVREAFNREKQKSSDNKF